MRIIREYQRREFCKDIQCPSQLKIDAASDKAAVDVVRTQECQKCLAHAFHKWLLDRDFQVAVIEE